MTEDRGQRGGAIDCQLCRDFTRARRLPGFCLSSPIRHSYETAILFWRFGGWAVRRLSALFRASRASVTAILYWRFGGWVDGETLVLCSRTSLKIQFDVCRLLASVFSLHLSPSLPAQDYLLPARRITLDTVARQSPGECHSLYFAGVFCISLS